MAKHVVAKAADCGPGQRILVHVAGRPIAVFNVGGEYFAVLNRCPHQGASLFHGIQINAITSTEPGRYECSKPGEVLRCPWHGWEFHLRTGESWFDPTNTKVRMYKTSVESGGTIEADQAPKKVEVFPIAAEADYLVIEV